MPKNLLKLPLPFVLCLCLFEKAELPFKTLYDFNSSENRFGETKAAKAGGETELLFGSEGGGEPLPVPPLGHTPQKYTQVASDHLQSVMLSLNKRCLPSSSPCLKYHLESFSHHKSIIALS